jgi:hypothetical protein
MAENEKTYIGPITNITDNGKDYYISLENIPAIQDKIGEIINSLAVKEAADETKTDAERHAVYTVEQKKHLEALYASLTVDDENNVIDTLKEVLAFFNGTEEGKTLVNFIAGLNVEQIGSDGNYIKFVSQTNGKIAATIQAFEPSVAATDASPSTINAPTAKAVRDAINALDKAEVGSDGSYIKKVKEDDGVITATKQAFDTSVGSSSTDNNAPTSKAVHTAITGAINALDVSNITTNLGTGKTITALSETDGKISATAENISITSSQISDKTNSYSETGETAVTGKSIKAAIDGLTDTLTGAPSASKTLTAFDEIGGKVTATFSDIAIAESQVTNLVTDLNNKADLVDGLVPAAQLPSYVDDVIEFAKQVSGAT